jgi:hypothetical protein
MVPQLEQGFLQPQVLLGTRKPQRLQVGGEAGKRGGRAMEVAFSPSLLTRSSEREELPASPLPRFPADLPKRIRSGEKRVGNPLDPDRGVGAMAAMHDGGIGQREELGLDGGHESRGIPAR